MAALAHVVPLTAVDGTYTYRVPPDLAAEAVPGARVLVSFGRRTITGVVAERVDGAPEGLKPILDVLDAVPALPPDLLALTRWVADYYVCAWGEAIRAALPSGTEVESHRVVRALVGPDVWTDDARGRRILKALAAREGGAMPVAEVAGVLDRKTVPQALLRRMERAGAVALDHEVQAARVQAKTQRHLRLVDAADAGGLRGARQQALVAFLADAAGAVLQADALRETGAASSTVHGLVERGLVEAFDADVERQPDGFDAEPPGPPPEISLHPDQGRALAALRPAIAHGAARTFLLWGVTGSGKTEVYLRALRDVLALGKAGIVLVPEIALTPQTVRRFQAHFPGQVAVLHSRMSAGERLDAWTAIRAGRYPVVIGPRSAVFAPVERLGLVIVDEEHEASYKQFDPAPRYHARDVAVMRAHRAGAVCVLGSATPSLESVHNAEAGKYVRLDMPVRVPVDGKAPAPLPPVRIIDLGREKEIRRLKGALSDPLRDALKARLARGEQAILLQNRRGFAPVLTCEDCGWRPTCRDCAVSLTTHKAGASLGSGQLRCHYCGRAERLPRQCPACGGHDLRLLGAGTQRVEDELAEVVPDARVLRMDLDTTTRKGAHRRILERFGRGEADILLGTQMVAKGLDFPRVTLVGVVDADTGMLLPDFRAAERAFSLLAQVAGRAGRHALPGEVLVQTRNPTHAAIQFALAHDAAGFARHESADRQALGYPPFGRLVGVEIKGPAAGSTQALAERWTAALAHEARRVAGAEVLGPVPAFVGRVKGWWRYHTLLKTPRTVPASVLAAAVRQVEARVPVPSGHRVNVDVDPVGLY